MGFLLLLGFLVFVLYHELGRSYLGSAESTMRDGLRVGIRAPAFSALDSLGRRVQFSPEADKETMLIFGAFGCAFCERLLPDLEDFDHEHGEIRTVLVFKVNPDGNDAGGTYETSVPMWTVSNNAAMIRYKVRVTPFGFLIDRDGVIRAKGLVNGKDHLEYLRETAEHDAAGGDPRPGLEEVHA